MEENMFWSSIGTFFKKIWLFISRMIRKFFSNIGYKLSVLFVLFSFIISLFFLIPSLFSRVPVFSYLIDNLSLPVSYELNGEVILLNADNESLIEPLDIYVGGYNVQSFSGEHFTLKFASEKSDYFYLTIEYKDDNGIDKYYTKRINTNGKNNLTEVVTVYV